MNNWGQVSTHLAYYFPWWGGCDHKLFLSQIYICIKYSEEELNLDFSWRLGTYFQGIYTKGKKSTNQDNGTGRANEWPYCSRWYGQPATATKWGQEWIPPPIGKVLTTLPLFRRNASLTVSGFHTRWTSPQKYFQLWPVVGLRNRVKETCYVYQSCFQRWSTTDRLE